MQSPLPDPRLGSLGGGLCCVQELCWTPGVRVSGKGGQEGPPPAPVGLWSPTNPSERSLARSISVRTCRGPGGLQIAVTLARTAVIPGRAGGPTTRACHHPREPVRAPRGRTVARQLHAQQPCPSFHVLFNVPPRRHPCHQQRKLQKLPEANERRTSTVQPSGCAHLVPNRHQNVRFRPEGR